MYKHFFKCYTEKTISVPYLAIDTGEALCNIVSHKIFYKIVTIFFFRSLYKNKSQSAT